MQDIPQLQSLPAPGEDDRLVQLIALTVVAIMQLGLPLLHLSLVLARRITTLA